MSALSRYIFMHELEYSLANLRSISDGHDAYPIVLVGNQLPADSVVGSAAGSRGLEKRRSTRSRAASMAYVDWRPGLAERANRMGHLHMGPGSASSAAVRAAPSAATGR